MRFVRAALWMGVAASLCAAPAGAVPIGGAGAVYYTNPANPTAPGDTGADVLAALGIGVGTQILWSADYTGTLGPGDQHFYPGDYAADGVTLTPGGLNSFALSVGDLSFSMTDDLDYPAFPDLLFRNGTFAGLSFYTTFDLVYGDQGGIVGWVPGSTYECLIYDGMDYATLTNGLVLEVGLVGDPALGPSTPLARGSVVPEPGTLVLLGSGLLGLVGAIRKRK